MIHRTSAPFQPGVTDSGGPSVEIRAAHEVFAPARPPPVNQKPDETFLIGEAIRIEQHS